ncbi:class F sortase [Paenibacillus spongiae]|uniref:Class F sortase n=1 Tax=Paenibacillus spongiae TaxID=2909671 RepID=A0ABY5S1Y7_9BACL|nr:class F sortase [Paenibacillus spongiae]UVI27458.1 class F sortase [Paenibacillus spongiae]
MIKKWILAGLLILMISCTIACSNDTRHVSPAPPPQKQQQKQPHAVKEPDRIQPIQKQKPQTQSSVDKAQSPPASTIKKPLKGVTPVRLYIPAVRIHAKLEPVSVTDKGQMDVPRSTERVGYLASPGTLPGAAGNAVMDGHVDTYNGPAVFFGLKKLKKGDAVVVKGSKGEKVTFVVESVETFKNGEAPIQKIFGSTDEARLNLITCAGKYSRSKKEHEARLVVFAKRVS